MKFRFKTIVLIILLHLIGFSANAQIDFEVPEDIELKVKEDYAKYEKDMIKAAKWLEETDLDKEKIKRKNANAFVIQWVTGSPTVTIDLTEKLTKIYGKNAELLVIYMASYSKYYIENKDSTSKPAAIKAAIISIINVYKKDIEIKKSKEMEKIIKQCNEGKLEDYIKENF